MAVLHDATPATVQTSWTRHGDDALDALDTALATHRADPLAPCTVLTPTPAAAVALRRELARRRGGLAGVGFVAVDGLAEQVLGAPDEEAGVPPDLELLVAAVRAELVENPRRFGRIATHRSTWEALARTAMELEPAVLDHVGDELVAHGGLVADIVAIAAASHARVGTSGVSTIRAATDRLATGAADRTVAEIGPVIWYLPALPDPATVDFVAALAARTPVSLVLGATGRAPDDAELASRLGVLGVGAAPATTPAVPTEVVTANDLDDEVRTAVRRLLARAEDDGVPLHRMALVHPPGPPYARIVADVLGGARIPWSGPSVTTLAQSVAGRVVLGVIEVAAAGFDRQAVVDLWSIGVLFDEAGPLPFSSFDEDSRRGGIVRGRDGWDRGIERLLGAVEERRRRQRDDGDTRADERAEVEHARIQRMAEALIVLDTLVDELPRTWNDVGAWAGAVLDRLCGPVSSRSWPEHELDADTAVRDVLARLARLAAVEAEPAPADVLDTVRTALDGPAPRATAAGTGLLVTTPDRPPAVPLDAVAVVGLAEGHLPRATRDDVLLGEQLRADLGLGVAGDHVVAERRGFDAALGAARSLRLLAFARNDQRSGRAQVPSRFLIDGIEAATGTRPRAEDLIRGTPVDGVTMVASATHGLAQVAAGGVALDDDERALADLVSAGVLDGRPAAAELAAGVLVGRSRRASVLTRFDGDLGGRGVDVTAEGVLSPTSLEVMAACPRRWFFAKVLRLGELERPESIERISARDRGTLTHLVLERFFGEAIDAGTVPPPGRPWTEAAHSRLDQIADDAFAEAEASGITGHARWWRHDQSLLREVLHATLDRDVAIRAQAGSMPVAVEFTFGRRGNPPLVVDLGDGRSIRLAGQADRVDRSGDGSVTVWDYKVASSRAYEALVKDEDRGGDPLAAGEKLQLVVYGLAAAGQTDAPVLAAYWMLRADNAGATYGYQLTDALTERFRRVLRVLVDELAAGRFPARPGEEQWHLGSHEHCAYCDFTAICPSDRAEEWERVRLDPRLDRARRLAEDGSRSVLVEPGDSGPAVLDERRAHGAHGGEGDR